MTARYRAISKFKAIDALVDAFCVTVANEGLYLSKAPDNADLPYGVFSVEQVEEMSDKGGLFGVALNVRFDFYDTEIPEPNMGAIAGGDDTTDEEGVFVVAEMDMVDMSVDKIDTHIYQKSVAIRYELQHIKR